MTDAELFQGAAGVRSALGNIADLIYRNQVEKPYVQAQTKNLGLQGENIAATTAGQGFENQLAQFKVKQAQRQAGSMGTVFPDLTGAAEDSGEGRAPTGPTLDMGAAAPPAEAAAFTPPAQTTTPKAATPKAVLPPVTPSPSVTLGGSVGGTDVQPAVSTKPEATPAMTKEEWLNQHNLYLDSNDQVQSYYTKPLIGNNDSWAPDAKTTAMAMKVINSSRIPWGDPRNKAKFSAGTSAPASSVVKPSQGMGDSTAPATMGAAPTPTPAISSPTSSSGSMNAGSTAGGASPESALPDVQPGIGDQITPPASPVLAPAGAPNPITYYNDLTPAQKAKVRAASEESYKREGVTTGVDESTVARDWNEHVSSLIPPMNWMTMQRMGFTPTKIGPNGMEAVNTSLVGAHGVGGRPQPFVMAADGTMHDNPDYLKPEQVAGHIADIGNLQEAQSVLNDARTVINTNPDAYGQALSNGAPGTEIGRFVTKVKAMGGNPQTYADQRKLDMQNLAGMLNKLSTIHIGRVTEMEWNALGGSIPKMTDDKETWNNWLGRVQNTLNYANQAKQMLVKPYLGDDSGQQLPNVDIGANVSAPGKAEHAYSAAEAAKLPKGFGRFLGDDGNYYKK